MPYNMKRDEALLKYREKATKESIDGWYKLLPGERKRKFISECLLEFVIRAQEEEIIYSEEIMEFFNKEMKIKPSGLYVSEAFTHNFGTKSTTLRVIVGGFGKPDYYIRKAGYVGFVKNPDIDLSKLYSIKKKYKGVGLRRISF